MSGDTNDSSNKETEQLRNTVAQLQSELEQVQQQKVQAAEYGLVVLEEKQGLAAKFSELEKEYDAVKHELQCAAEALTQNKICQRKFSVEGTKTEETLLFENANKEAGFRGNIADLDSELRRCRKDLSRFREENSHMKVESSDIAGRLEAADTVHRQLKHEIKELKLRETRSLQDYSELEEENISLQKQVSQLRQSQIEFEALKLENRRLYDDNLDLSSQLTELARLKRIVESNLEEAMTSLQQERDQRHSLKKELDQQRENESMLKYSQMAQSLSGEMFLGLSSPRPPPPPKGTSPPPFSL